MFDTPAARFRTVAVAEAISWAFLLIAMVFKYAMDQPLGVTIFGWVHGIVFVAYLVVVAMVWKPLRWSPLTIGLALLASIPPFGSVLFERLASRKGHLEPAS